MGRGSQESGDTWCAGEKSLNLDYAILERPCLHWEKGSNHQRLYLSSTVQTLTMLISSDHKENSRPCYGQFALLSRGFHFSFAVEDPKTVIRSAAGHEGHGQNPVLCKAGCKRHTVTILNLVPLWRAYRAGFALGCSSRPGTRGPICQSRWSSVLLSSVASN